MFWDGIRYNELKKTLKYWSDVPRKSDEKYGKRIEITFYFKRRKILLTNWSDLNSYPDLILIHHIKIYQSWKISPNISIQNRKLEISFESESFLVVGLRLREFVPPPSVLYRSDPPVWLHSAHHTRLLQTDSVPEARMLKSNAECSEGVETRRLKLFSNIISLELCRLYIKMDVCIPVFILSHINQSGHVSTRCCSFNIERVRRLSYRDSIIMRLL